MAGKKKTTKAESGAQLFLSPRATKAFTGSPSRNPILKKIDKAIDKDMHKKQWKKVTSGSSSQGTSIAKSAGKLGADTFMDATHRAYRSKFKLPHGKR